MLHDVAAGMMFLHTRKYVHGDLRSPNLFVGTDGQVKIGDFGFVKQLASGSDSMQVRRVTHPRWVAPEVGAKLARIVHKTVCLDMSLAASS